MGDYALAPGGFATGFSSPGRTWPGYAIRLAFIDLTIHIVPEQYSIQKEYPKHSVSRKNLFLYSNLRNNFQTNQKLGAF